MNMLAVAIQTADVLQKRHPRLRNILADAATKKRLVKCKR